MRGRIGVGVVLVGASLFGASAAWAESDLLERAVEQQARAVSPGAHRAAPPKRGSAPQSDWIADLAGGQCYCFSAGGGPGVRRVAITLLSLAGVRLAEARTVGPWSTLVYCPKATAPHRVHAAIEGAGPWLVGEYVRPATPADAAPPPPPAATATNAPPIADPYGVTVIVPGVRVTVGAAGAPPVAAAPPQQCLMGADGMNACGYDCHLGANGHAYCAGVPGGRCALNSDGTYSCSQPAAAAWGVAVPRQDCLMGADGTNACGYDCHLGANGRAYCAGVPGGRCALNSDGTYSCSQAPGAVLPPARSSRRSPNWPPPRAERGEECENSLDCGSGLFCRDGVCE